LFVSAFCRPNECMRTTVMTVFALAAIHVMNLRKTCCNVKNEFFNEKNEKKILQTLSKNVTIFT